MCRKKQEKNPKFHFFKNARQDLKMPHKRPKIEDKLTEKFKCQATSKNAKFLQIWYRKTPSGNADNNNKSLVQSLLILAERKLDMG
jgi:hypothetical protein